MGVAFLLSPMRCQPAEYVGAIQFGDGFARRVTRVDHVVAPKTDRFNNGLTRLLRSRLVAVSTVTHSRRSLPLPGP